MTHVQQHNVSNCMLCRLWQPAPKCDRLWTFLWVEKVQLRVSALVLPALNTAALLHGLEPQYCHCLDASKCCCILQLFLVGHTRSRACCALLRCYGTSCTQDQERSCGLKFYDIIWPLELACVNELNRM